MHAPTERLPLASLSINIPKGHRVYNVRGVLKIRRPELNYTIISWSDVFNHQINAKLPLLKQVSGTSSDNPMFHIYSGCSGEQEFLNRTNGEIIFHSNYPYHYYYYQRNQLCSWNIMAHKGEQVKLVLKHVDLHWCGWSCSCGHLEIENGTYEDGSATTRMCNNLLGNVTIYSHVGYGLTLNALYFAFRSLFFRASYTVISHKDTESDGK